MAKLNQPIDRNPRVLIQSIGFYFWHQREFILHAMASLSVDVELKVLCLQSRAAEEASERAKREKLVENYVSAEEKYKTVKAHCKAVAAELEARRAEVQALRLAFVQEYGVSDDKT